MASNIFSKNSPDVEVPYELFESNQKLLKTNKRKIVLCLILGLVAILTIVLIFLFVGNGQKYPGYADIIENLAKYSTDFPENAEIINIGKSVNGRNIPSLS